MRIVLTGLVALTFGLSMAPVAVQAEDKAEAPASASTFTVGIGGMDCDGCAKEVRKRLKKIDGVANVKVDLAGEKAVITMQDGKSVDEAAVKKALEGTEFTVTSFEGAGAGEKKSEEKKEEKKEGAKS